MIEIKTHHWTANDKVTAWIDVAHCICVQVLSRDGSFDYLEKTNNHSSIRYLIPVMGEVKVLY